MSFCNSVSYFKYKLYFYISVYILFTQPSCLRDGNANNKSMYHSSHNLLPGVLSNLWGRKQGGLGWSQSCFFGGQALRVESQQVSISSGLIARLQEFKVCPLPSCVWFYMTRNKKLRFRRAVFSWGIFLRKKKASKLTYRTDKRPLAFWNPWLTDWYTPTRSKLVTQNLQRQDKLGCLIQEGKNCKFPTMCNTQW